MEATITLLDRMTFSAVSDSGHAVRIDTGLESGGDDSAARPIELVAMALGSCTAMDVISILRKKKQDVTNFEVLVHAEKAEEHPKVFTGAVLTYVVSGRGVEEAAVRRAIELSAQKYCPVHSMLSKVFPIELNYSILDAEGCLITSGAFEPEYA